MPGAPCPVDSLVGLLLCLDAPGLGPEREPEIRKAPVWARGSRAPVASALAASAVRSASLPALAASRRSARSSHEVKSKDRPGPNASRNLGALLLLEHSPYTDGASVKGSRLKKTLSARGVRMVITYAKLSLRENFVSMCLLRTLERMYAYAK